MVEDEGVGVDGEEREGEGGEKSWSEEEAAFEEYFGFASFSGCPGSFVCAHVCVHVRASVCVCVCICTHVSLTTCIHVQVYLHNVQYGSCVR